MSLRQIQVTVPKKLAQSLREEAAGLVVPDYYLLDSGQIQARIRPNLVHVGLAIGAGVAGALSLTSVAINNLVGVAVAVALMPPAIVTGMGIGQADWTMARGAGLLLAVNILAG